MNVIFGQESLDLVSDKYSTLELDTLYISESAQAVTSYAVLTPDEIPLGNFGQLGNMMDLHAALLKNYKEANWTFCEQAVEQLRGKFPRLVDEFYDVLIERVELIKASNDAKFNPVVDVSNNK